MSISYQQILWVNICFITHRVKYIHNIRAYVVCVCVSVCDTCVFPLVLEEHTILTLELNAMVQIIANISFNFLEVFPKKYSH